MLAQRAFRGWFYPPVYGLKPKRFPIHRPLQTLPTARTVLGRRRVYRRSRNGARTERAAGGLAYARLSAWTGATNTSDRHGFAVLRGWFHPAGCITGRCPP